MLKSKQLELFHYVDHESIRPELSSSYIKTYKNTKLNVIKYPKESWSIWLDILPTIPLRMIRVAR